MSTTALTPYARAKAMVTSPNVAQSLASYLKGTPIPPEKFALTVVSLFNQNPKLVECAENNPAAFMTSVAIVAQQGLQFIGGQAYLVPFRDKNKGMVATPIIGYQGMVELVYASGRIKPGDLRCPMIFKGDTFIYDPASGSVTHGQRFDVDKSDDAVIGGYMTVNGKLVDEPLTRADFDDAMNRSRASDYGPWKTHYRPMCKKTIMRRCAKWLPKSNALNIMLEAEDRAERGTPLDDLVMMDDEPRDVTPAANPRDVDLDDEDIPA